MPQAPIDESPAPRPRPPTTPPNHPRPPEPPPSGVGGGLADMVGGAVDSAVRGAQQGLSQADPRTPFIGPIDPTASLRGWRRFDQLMRNRPFLLGAERVASHDYDQWILSVKSDPADPEYNQLLLNAQFGARWREKQREEILHREAPDDDDEEEAPGAGAMPKGTRRAPVKRPAKQPRASKLEMAPPLIVDEHGQPVADPRLQSEGGLGAVGQSGALAPPGTPQLQIGDKVRDGTYVYVSTKMVGQRYADRLTEDTEGRTTKRPGPRITSQSHQFMSKDDAEILINTWDERDIAAFQKLYKLPETGLVDKTTFNKWKDVVAAGARYTQAEKNVNLLQLAIMLAPRKKAKKGGGGGGGGRGGRGGGGGGGGAGANYTASQVKGFLNGVMEQEVGREANADEQAQFLAALRGAGDVDPHQFAIDWIRQQLGGEAGAFSAINYYDAMLQVLGANTQAEGA